MRGNSRLATVQFGNRVHNPTPVYADDDKADVTGKDMRPFNHAVQRLALIPQLQPQRARGEYPGHGHHHCAHEEQHVQHVVQARFVQHLAEKSFGDADDPVPVKNDVNE